VSIRAPSVAKKSPRATKIPPKPPIYRHRTTTDNNRQHFHRHFSIPPLRQVPLAARPPVLSNAHRACSVGLSPRYSRPLPNQPRQNRTNPNSPLAPCNRGFPRIFTANYLLPSGFCLLSLIRAPSVAKPIYKSNPKSPLPTSNRGFPVPASASPAPFPLSTGNWPLATASHWQPTTGNYFPHFPCIPPTSAGYLSPESSKITAGGAARHFGSDRWSQAKRPNIYWCFSHFCVERSGRCDSLT
jgi:hypothetical protein